MQKPVGELRSPGILSQECIGKPSAGYISGGGTTGYSAMLCYEMVRGAGCTAQIAVHDIQTLTVHRRNSGGRVLRVEEYQEEERTKERFISGR